MSENNKSIMRFDGREVRTHWDVGTEEWFFSVVDVVGVLSDQATYDGARNYWKVLKTRLKGEGSQLVTNCNQLKMKSPKDGKFYDTDVLDTKGVLRLVQSIPSSKAEPFMWLAKVGAERIEQIIDPERSFEQGVADSISRDRHFCGRAK